MAKVIPANIECITYDEALENAVDGESAEWFRCGRCLLEFASHPSIKHPKACPNCSELFIWRDR